MLVVTSVEFLRNPGPYQDKAMIEPVTITENGRNRLVLLSVDEYRRLMRRDRKVGLTSELSDEQLEAISKARVPDEHAHLDAELKDWTP